MRLFTDYLLVCIWKGAIRFWLCIICYRTMNCTNAMDHLGICCRFRTRFSSRKPIRVFNRFGFIRTSNNAVVCWILLLVNLHQINVPTLCRKPTACQIVIHTSDRTLFCCNCSTSTSKLITLGFTRLSSRKLSLSSPVANSRREQTRPIKCPFWIALAHTMACIHFR